MKTSQLFSRVFKSSPKNSRRRIQHNRYAALERLESRQMLTAAFAWDGDALKITGSAADDFIAVQQDDSGVHVFSDDTLFTEYEGRAFDTATSIEVDAMGGDDILISYQTDASVNLFGGAGNDILFSDSEADLLDGGEGDNWLYSPSIRPETQDAFGITGLSLPSDAMTLNPAFSETGPVELTIDIDGTTDLFGLSVDVAGTATVSNEGFALEVSSNVPVWEDALGFDNVDLTNTAITLSASNSNETTGYIVSVDSQLDLEGTLVDISGQADITEEFTTLSFTGSVQEWDHAFAVPHLELTDAALTGTGLIQNGVAQDLSLALTADMLIQQTVVNVSGQVNLSRDRTEVELQGTVNDWQDAFGIQQLDLQNAQLEVLATSSSDGSSDLQLDIAAQLEQDGTLIDLEGSAEIQAESIDAVFSAAVENWDDAFGVDSLDLKDVEVQLSATKSEQQEAVRFDLFADLDLNGTSTEISGSVEVTPESTQAVLSGDIQARWLDAFGINGLILEDTSLQIQATNDQSNGSVMTVDIDSDMDILGTDVDVSGLVTIQQDSIEAEFAAVVAGGWVNAFGINALKLNDTELSVAGRKTSSGSTLTLGVDTGVEVLGTNFPFQGTVEITGDEVRSVLTSSIDGDWGDAFGLPGLNLRNTGLSISSQTGSSDDSQSGFSISLDTDLQLFGSYIDVIGDLNLSPSGFDLSFTPPESLDLPDLLGISGFSLEDVNLTVDVSTEGLTVGLASLMDMGNIDVDFQGDITIGNNGITASLSGTVAEWANAFEVPGLNLSDVVLALEAETGPGGASLEIGLGAGIKIGSTQLDVAGLIGVGPTGWRAAFRGGVDSLTGDDLIDFANTLNTAADPNAKLIEDGAIGDIEVKDAYINFAPYGGNEALGITDGFGIGGEFLNDSKSLGSGELVVDVARGVFELDLAISSLSLGPIGIRDVVIDIRMAPTDSHFYIAGTASLMGASVTLNGQISKDNFSLSGQTTLDVAGLTSSVQFIVDTHGVRFTATSNGAFINAAKDAAIGGLKAAANVAQDAIDMAQEAVEKARRGVESLEAELADARKEAQAEVDKIKANIAKAKAVVDSTRASRDYWASRKSSHYRSWRSAVSKTKSAKWYDKPYYKSIEVARYTRYKATSARYSIQVGIYNTANATYNAVRSAAGWVLDSAGVEANPNVLRIKALLAAANLGLDATEMVLDGAEELSSGALKALNYADSLKVNRITISGKVTTGTGAGFRVAVDYELDGRSHLLELDASTEDIGKQLAQQMIAMVV